MVELNQGSWRGDRVLLISDEAKEWRSRLLEVFSFKYVLWELLYFFFEHDELHLSLFNAISNLLVV